MALQPLLGIMACVSIYCASVTSAAAAAGAVSIKFVTEPDDPFYIFNAVNVTLEWKYEIIGSQQGLLALSWHAKINGSFTVIATVTFGPPYSEKVDPSRNKVVLRASTATLIIKNISDQDITSYKIRLYHDTAKDLYGNTTIIRAVPPLINPIANRTIAEGLNITLSCNASGIPPPKYEWRKRGSSDILSNDSIYLVSKNISRDETGWYQCTATNGFGSPASQDVYTDVHFSPTIKKLTTSISSSFVGQNITICCVADGNPPPGYYWIAPNKLFVRQTGTCVDVELDSSDYFGNYTCFANNSIGENSRSKIVQELFRPKKIERIKYDARPYGILLTWNKTKYDGGSKIVRYIVSVSDETGKFIKEKLTSSSRFDLKGLTRNTNYTICVQAENIVGRSNNTCAPIRTLNEGKPEQPSTPKVVVVGQKATVTWSEPSPDVHHYIVKYSKEGWTNWTEINVTKLTLDLDDLDLGNYNVQVVAENTYGKSLPSPNQTFAIVLTTTTASSTNDPEGQNKDGNGGETITTIVIVISVLTGLILIVAIVFFALWMKRRSGRGDEQAESVNHSAGPLNGDVYAVVDNSKKAKKKPKPKKGNDLVYAELSDLTPAAEETKPASYEPTDYADISHIMTPNADLMYSNVKSKCNEEGVYANVEEVTKK